MRASSLETERLLLRDWRPEDEEPFARINADPQVGRYLLGRAESRDETARTLQRIQEHWNRWGYGLWAVEHKADRRFLGFIGLSHHRWFPEDVEIGWRLDPRYWNRGFATEGARAALQYAFDELALDHIISIIHRDNVASRRVAEKLGLTVWRVTDFDHPESGDPMPIVVYRRGAAVKPDARSTRSAQS